MEFRPEQPDRMEIPEMKRQHQEPDRLAQAYADAGYFAGNVRTVKVLIDREAVQNGAAANGTSWQYFDLGHGYCTYNFFEQCPHRMACARCDSIYPRSPPGLSS